VTLPLDSVAGDVFDDIAALIERSNDIGCLAHKDADADSLGSALGFAISMREMGHRVHTMAPAPVPRLLSFLPGYETLENGYDGPLDSLFTFDCASLSRFGEKREIVEHTRDVVNIDHHASSERFGTINLVDAKASATGQVVYGMLQQLGAPITPDVATNLYAALFTDTGGFRHENTTEAALRLGADLVKRGADPGWVALKTYKSRSVPRMRLEALAIARLQSELDGRLIWSDVSQAMLAEAGTGMDESEGVIDQLQSIDTMQLAVLFKEYGPTTTKISVRTRHPYDATEVCKPFGGGGHHRAAGAELQQPLDAAREAVLPVAIGLLERPR
jgi:phosphoesterase RecJ-like protein